MLVERTDREPHEATLHYPSVNSRMEDFRKRHDECVLRQDVFLNDSNQRSHSENSRLYQIYMESIDKKNVTNYSNNPNPGSHLSNSNSSPSLIDNGNRDHKNLVDPRDFAAVSSGSQTYPSPVITRSEWSTDPRLAGGQPTFNTGSYQRPTVQPSYGAFYSNAAPNPYPTDAMQSCYHQHTAPDFPQKSLSYTDGFEAASNSNYPPPPAPLSSNPLPADNKPNNYYEYGTAQHFSSGQQANLPPLQPFQRYQGGMGPSLAAPESSTFDPMNKSSITSMKVSPPLTPINGACDNNVMNYYNGSNTNSGTRLSPGDTIVDLKFNMADDMSSILMRDYNPSAQRAPPTLAPMTNSGDTAKSLQRNECGMYESGCLHPSSFNAGNALSSLLHHTTSKSTTSLPNLTTNPVAPAATTITKRAYNTSKHGPKNALPKSAADHSQSKEAKALAAKARKDQRRLLKAQKLSNAANTAATATTMPNCSNSIAPTNGTVKHRGSGGGAGKKSTLASSGSAPKESTFPPFPADTINGSTRSAPSPYFLSPSTTPSFNNYNTHSSPFDAVTELIISPVSGTAPAQPRKRRYNTANNNAPNPTHNGTAGNHRLTVPPVPTLLNDLPIRAELLEVSKAAKRISPAAGPSLESSHFLHQTSYIDPSSTLMSFPDHTNNDSGDSLLLAGSMMSVTDHAATFGKDEIHQSQQQQNHNIQAFIDTYQISDDIMSNDAFQDILLGIDDLGDGSSVTNNNNNNASTLNISSSALSLMSHPATVVDDYFSPGPIEKNHHNDDCFVFKGNGSDYKQDPKEGGSLLSPPQTFDNTRSQLDVTLCRPTDFKAEPHWAAPYNSRNMSGPPPPAQLFYERSWSDQQPYGTTFYDDNDRGRNFFNEPAVAYQPRVRMKGGGVHHGSAPFINQGSIQPNDAPTNPPNIKEEGMAKLHSTVLKKGAGRKRTMSKSALNDSPNIINGRAASDHKEYLSGHPFSGLDTGATSLYHNTNFSAGGMRNGYGTNDSIFNLNTSPDYSRMNPLPSEGNSYGLKPTTNYNPVKGVPNSAPSTIKKSKKGQKAALNNNNNNVNTSIAASSGVDKKSTHSTPTPKSNMPCHTKQKMDSMGSGGLSCNLNTDIDPYNYNNNSDDFEIGPPNPNFRKYSSGTNPCDIPDPAKATIPANNPSYRTSNKFEPNFPNGGPYAVNNHNAYQSPYPHNELTHSSQHNHQLGIHQQISSKPNSSSSSPWNSNPNNPNPNRPYLPYDSGGRVAMPQHQLTRTNVAPRLPFPPFDPGNAPAQTGDFGKSHNNIPYDTNNHHHRSQHLYNAAAAATVATISNTNNAGRGTSHNAACHEQQQPQQPHSYGNCYNQHSYPHALPPPSAPTHLGFGTEPKLPKSAVSYGAQSQLNRNANCGADHVSPFGNEQDDPFAPQKVNRDGTPPSHYTGNQLSALDGFLNGSAGMPSVRGADPNVQTNGILNGTNLSYGAYPSPQQQQQQLFNQSDQRSATLGQAPTSQHRQQNLAQQMSIDERNVLHDFAAAADFFNA